jgi:hypothetical protein
LASGALLMPLTHVHVAPEGGTRPVTYRRGLESVLQVDSPRRGRLSWRISPARKRLEASSRRDRVARVEAESRPGSLMTALSSRTTCGGERAVRRLAGSASSGSLRVERKTPPVSLGVPPGWWPLRSGGQAPEADALELQARRLRSSADSWIDLRLLDLRSAGTRFHVRRRQDATATARSRQPRARAGRWGGSGHGRCDCRSQKLTDAAALAEGRGTFRPFALPIGEAITTVGPRGGRPRARQRARGPMRPPLTTATVSLRSDWS